MISDWAQIAGAVGTIVLAALTYTYVRATQGILREAKEARRVQTRPYVVAFFTIYEHNVYLNIKNTGQTAAEQVELARPDSFSRIYAHPELEPEFLKTGIPFLVPGHVMRTFLNSFPDYTRLTEAMGYDRSWRCTIAYTDHQTKERYQEEAVMDLNQFLNRGSSNTNVTEKDAPTQLVKEIQQIKEAIRELAV